ncbi:MAG: RNA recognition motif domain-containing protein [Candidatus Roseilinea sp.]|uniref:RNA recognition motif domain-containing protein n=1 Tax=Candidatus Roseilinea sp. TaxID=2838777 RepID=UPI0040496CC5
MNNKLYVGNLSYDTTEQDLRELFGQSGNIRSVTIPNDRMTGQPRGFAFVEMETPAEALVAIKACNGRELGGREIKVNEARPPEARSGGFGRRDNRGSDRGGRNNRRF